MPRANGRASTPQLAQLGRAIRRYRVAEDHRAALHARLADAILDAHAAGAGAEEMLAVLVEAGGGPFSKANLYLLMANRRKALAAPSPVG